MSNQLEKIKELIERRATARMGGGDKAIAKQHDKGKYTARERIAMLLDEGSFEEMDMFVEHRCTNFGMEKKKVNLSAYQMAAEVMDRAGIHEGTIFRYHQARRNTRNYQVDLETLQYDLLYGEKYAYKDKELTFERTKMRMPPASCPR